MSGVTSSSLCWLLLCVNLLVSADQIHIQAEPGQTVILPCRAPDSNSPVTAVEWSRPDLEPEHVLLYNEDYSYPENQHPSFKNRVDLQDRRMKDGDASLILKDVRTEDSGTYECSVIQRGDQKTWKRDAFNTEPIRTINLSVGSAADEGTRREEGTNNGGNQSGSVDQRNISATPGHQRVLTCRDPQTGNIVAVEWKRKDLSGYVLRYRDEHYDDENQNPSYQNRVHLQDRLMRNRDVSLVLEKVNFTDRGTYECHSQVAGSIERKQICSITLNVSARESLSDGQQRNGYTLAVVLLGSLLVSTGHF